MKKKLKLLFVVCFVSIALGLSAGTANATAIATADATLALTPIGSQGPSGIVRPNWKYSAAVALAAIPDVPVVVLGGPDIKPSTPPLFPLETTFASAIIPSPFGPVGSIAGTNQVFTPIPFSFPGVMQSVSAAILDWPHPGGIAGSAAGFLGEFRSTDRRGTLVGLTAIDQLNLTLMTDFTGEHAAGFAVAGIFLKNLRTHELLYDIDIIGRHRGDGDDFSYSTGFPPNELSTGLMFFPYQDVGIWGAFVATGVKAEPVPEPTTMALFGMGMVGLVGAGVRRKYKKKEVEKS